MQINSLSLLPLGVFHSEWKGTSAKVAVHWQGC
jgi:hypothetical protein